VQISFALSIVPSFQELLLQLTCESTLMIIDVDIKYFITRSIFYQEQKMEKKKDKDMK
jgi:hypothetical protein